MPLARRSILEDRFLEELSKSLDLPGTIEKLGITEDDARAILKGLVSKKAAHKDLFEGVKKAAPAGKGSYTLNVDGASRGNPGKAGAGGVIRDPEGRVVKRLKKYLGVMTNNGAEYQALIMGLKEAHELGVGSIKVLSDSELLVKQLKGEYRVKSPDLRPLYEKAVGLLEGFRERKVSHVYREENSMADELANEAIDGHKDF